MKNRNLIIFSLMIFLIATFAYAVQLTKELPGYGTITGNYVEQSINFEKGWNLIHGFPNPDWLSGGDIEKNNIKAIYGLNPISVEYARFYPNPESDKIGGSNFAWSESIKMNAFWVYSNKGGRSKITTLEPLALNKVQLLKGWNFVGIVPEMEDSRFEDYAGTCDVNKIYTWSGINQRWSSHPNPLAIYFERYDVGNGFLVKVSSDCSLGEVAEAEDEIIAPPPGIPGGETNVIRCSENDGGKDYNKMGVSTGSKIGSTQTTWTDNCATSVILVEYYCSEDNVESTSYSCPNGCQNGACI